MIQVLPPSGGTAGTTVFNEALRKQTFLLSVKPQITQIFTDHFCVHPCNLWQFKSRTSQFELRLVGFTSINEALAKLTIVRRPRIAEALAEAQALRRRKLLIQVLPPFGGTVGTTNENFGKLFQTGHFYFPIKRLAGLGFQRINSLF
jgi:hypothetical protein